MLLPLFILILFKNILYVIRKIICSNAGARCYGTNFYLEPSQQLYDYYEVTIATGVINTCYYLCDHESIHLYFCALKVNLLSDARILLPDEMPGTFFFTRLEKKK